jgi:hypothetical protein
MVLGLELSGTLRILGRAILGGLVCRWLFKTAIAWYRLRQFPGPPLASVSYLWLARAVISGKTWKIQADAIEKYGGPLTRIGPDLLVTNDPAIVRQINSARSRYTKDWWYNSMRMDPYQHTMLSSNDDAYHDDVKARTSFGYSGREVPTLEADIEEQIENLKDLIRRKYISEGAASKPMDFAHAAQFFTLDSLSKIAYGKEFGYLAEDRDVNGYIKVMEDMAMVYQLCVDLPAFQSVMTNPTLLKLVGPKPTDKSGPGVMLGFVTQIYTQRCKQKFTSDGVLQRRRASRRLTLWTRRKGPTGYASK